MEHHEEVEEEAWIYNGQEKVPPTVRRVKIAENVIEIPDETFEEHRQLEEVILSSSVQVIGKWAFCGCEKLNSIFYQSLDGEETQIGIPSTVKVIDDRAFSDCIRLARLDLSEGLERIGECAFYLCESLTEVEIPSTVEVIGDCAFYACRRMARLVLNQGLEKIGKAAFHSCESLTEVDFPLTVKVIDDFALFTCRLLARLVLNEGLERIGNSAFRSCDCLTEVEIPSTVKVIGDWAFYYCNLLARLGLNEGLERIGQNAFCACDSLSHVRIPRSVNSFATNAFTKCSSLISIELPDECPFNINLSGCLSLVNLAGQISILFQDERRREEFFQSSKLGSLVDDEDDLKLKLNHRFDNSPLNKLCYYQSYQSVDVAMAQLRILMEDDPLAATTQVDEFGMTPLHVLSLSQTTNLDMLLAVMDAGKPGHMVRVRDSFGSTPMDYLFLNRMPNSSEVIRRIFQTRFEQVLGLDQFWKSVTLQAIDKILAGDWASRKSETSRIIRKYERKEILSLVELYLWKMKNDEATSSKKVKIGVATSKEAQILADRQKRRFISGAAVVIPHVLLFLDTISSVSNEG